MAVKYKVEPRHNLKNPEEPKKFYARAISSGRVELKEIAESIAARGSTVGSADVQAVLLLLIEEIKARISRGETIALGDLGYFHLTLSGKGAPTTEAFSPALIERAKLRFVPGSEIEGALKTVKFEKDSTR